VRVPRLAADEGLVNFDYARKLLSVSHPKREPDSMIHHYEFHLENNEARFKELVLYVAHACVSDPSYSKIKLLKRKSFRRK